MSYQICIKNKTLDYTAGAKVLFLTIVIKEFADNHEFLQAEGYLQGVNKSAQCSKLTSSCFDDDIF